MTEYGQAGPPRLLPPPPMAPRPPLRRRGRRLAGVGVALVVLVVAVAVMAVIPHEVTGHAVAVQDPLRSEGGRSAPKAVPELATNPLLANGVKLGKVACDLPELGTTPAELSAFYTALSGCLEKAWRPALVRADEPSEPVKVSVTLPKVSACGAAPSENEAVAYYCGGDTTIYAPADWMLSDAGQNRARHLATIAHEYGHHVQDESGILAAAGDRMGTPNQDSPSDQALVRRIELQANCFGALFIAAAEGRGSINRATANAAVADYGRADDSDDHGTRAHQLAWAKAGYSTGATSACNTWSAAESEVT